MSDYTGVDISGPWFVWGNTAYLKSEKGFEGFEEHGYKGRPNEDDLKAAREFARNIKSSLN